MSTDGFKERLHSEGCLVFGTGFVATLFLEALDVAGLADRVRGYLATKPADGASFDGFDVKYASDPSIDRSALVCIAVHESNLASVEETLEREGYTNTEWVYPHLNSLIYGEPLYRDVSLPLDMVLSRQDPASNWLAIRAIAAWDTLTEERTGHDIYVAAQALHCSEETAERRYGLLQELVESVRVNGFDPSQPVSATIYQNGTDWKDPCLTRMYGEPIERDPSRSHINVDPSQTLFVSTISNSAEPLSSVPGQPFDTNISRAELDSETVDVSSASLATAKSLTISNSLIAANSGSGSGAIYIAEDGTAALYNVTLANNSANDAAVYYAGANSSAVTIANAIIVNNATSPLFGVASAPGSLVDASGVANATVYSGGTLFTNAESGDYSLASGSEASNIGVDAQALDVYGNVLSVDLAGANRFSGTVDAGAYEFQGAAPAAPTNVTISDYVESNKAPVLSWTASTSSDVLAYNVYQIDGNNKTVVATVNTTSFADLSSVVSIADNQLYTFGVAAVSEYGVSSIATVKLNTVVAPAAPKNVAFSEYTGGASATLTWTASKNATGYKIEALNASNKWVTVGTVTETSYVATVEENATYSYRVSAFTTVDSVSKYSKTVKADLNTVVAPAAPTNVAFAEYAGGTSATLTWDASENASGYLVETLNASNVWETVGTVTETSYVATVEENATYSYRVSAFTTVDSETKYSTTVAADLNTVVAPAAPKNVKFAEYTGGTSATLTWTASKNATGYKIEALNASNKWVTVGTVTGTSYVATVEENADYSYRVSAYTTVDSVSKYSKTVKADCSRLRRPLCRLWSNERRRMDDACRFGYEFALYAYWDRS